MFARLRRVLSDLHHDTAGAMAVEKILLLALIALPIIIGLALFRHTIQGWFASWSTQVEQQNNQGTLGP